MKKKIIIALLATVSIMATACGNSLGNSSDGAKTEITMSNIIENEEDEQSNVVSNTPNTVEKSTKISVISNQVLELLGGEKDALIEIITDSQYLAKVEETEDGINITTESVSQRAEIVSMLSDKVQDKISALRDDGVRVNYDVLNGYIDIYCQKKDAKNVESYVNSVVGMMALGQKINQNSLEWNILVTVNDADAGLTVLKDVISEENVKFSLSEDSWDVGNSTDEVNEDADENGESDVTEDIKDDSELDGSDKTESEEGE